MKNILSSVMKLNLVLFLFCSTMSFAQDEEIDVPFVVLEDIPKFPNCVDVPYEDAKNCFMQEMNNHIRLNFRYPSIAKKKNIQGRVTVKFIINGEGNVINVETKAPEGCELLAEEAARIIKLLPKFKPGMQKGKPVSVSYAQPIMFKLESTPSVKKEE